MPAKNAQIGNFLAPGAILSLRPPFWWYRLANMAQKQPVKELRGLLGLTQEEFAAQIGVTAGRVSQVEAGDGHFKIGIYLYIASHWRIELAKLGYSVEDLLRSVGASAA
jgi:DNA-binding XRE family transcriptional regulator